MNPKLIDKISFIRFMSVIFIAEKQSPKHKNISKTGIPSFVRNLYENIAKNIVIEEIIKKKFIVNF